MRNEEGCSVKLDIDSDGYHRCLLFLILDLHKSEVGSSNIYIYIYIYFFFFKNIFFMKNNQKLFHRFPRFPMSVTLGQRCEGVLVNCTAGRLYHIGRDLDNFRCLLYDVIGPIEF